MIESKLKDADFPMGRGPPEGHPKRQQLTRLINYNAPEYAISPKSEGFLSSEHDRFIRSRHAIITTVIEELMQDGGRFMIKKNGVWVVRVDFNSNTKQVRNLVQDRFNRVLRSWKGDLRPLPALDEPQPAQSNDEQGCDGSESLDDDEEEKHDTPIEVHQQPDKKDNAQPHLRVEQLNNCEIMRRDVFVDVQKPPEDEIVPPDGKMCMREILRGFIKSYADADGGESDRIAPEAVSETSSSSDEPPTHVPTLSREAYIGEFSRASEHHFYSVGVLSEIKQGNGPTTHVVSTALLSESHPTDVLRPPPSLDDIPEVQEGSRKSRIDSTQIQENENENEDDIQSCSWPFSDEIGTLLASFEWNEPLEDDDVIVAESGLSQSPSTPSIRPLSPPTRETQDVLQRRRKRAKLGTIGIVGLTLTAILLAVFVPETSNDREVAAPTSAPMISTPRLSCLEDEIGKVLVFDDFEDSTENWTTNKTTILAFDDGNDTHVLGLFDSPVDFPQIEVGIPNDLQGLFITLDFYVVSDYYAPYSLGMDLSWGAGNVKEVDFGLFNGPRGGEDTPRSKEASSDLAWTLETQDDGLNTQHHNVRIWMGSEYAVLSEGRLGVKIRWALPNRATARTRLGIDNFSITGCHQLAGSSGLLFDNATDVTYYSGVPTLLPTLSPSMQSSLASLGAPTLERPPSSTRPSSPSQSLQKPVSSTSGPNLTLTRSPSSAMPVSLLNHPRLAPLAPSLSPTSTPSMFELERSQPYTQPHLPSTWRNTKSPSHDSATFWS